MDATEHTLGNGPLIRLQGASVTRGSQKLLASVDFALHPGARWALFGENGAGKTTLLRLLRGEFPPDAGGVREYRLDGQPPQPTVLGLRQRLALVSADMTDAYAVQGWRATGLDCVLAGFGDAALLYAEPTSEQLRRSVAVLAELDLTELAKRPVASMSTGEARKILLARAVAVQPDVLFLDECLEGLDVASRREYLALLDRIAAGPSSPAMLFTTHRLDELPSCLTQALVLQAGRVVACGPLAEVRHTLGLQRQTTVISPTLKSPVSTITSAAVPAQVSMGQPLLRIRNADVHIEGKQLLFGVDWTILPGEHWAVLGKNGAGKSTLLALVLGEHWPSALNGPPGCVEYGFGDGTTGHARTRLGWVSAALQAGYSYDVRVEEAVWSGFSGSIGVYAEPSPEERQRTLELLEQFGLGTLAQRRIRSLSRGQLRRVLLARALAGNPALLLLDEPLAGLDTASRRRTRDLLEGIARSGTPLVMVSHHERDLPPSVNRVLLMEGGCVRFQGSREAFLAQGGKDG